MNQQIRRGARGRPRPRPLSSRRGGGLVHHARGASKFFSAGNVEGYGRTFVHCIEIVNWRAIWQMETVTYDLFAILRDIAAILLLLGNFSLLVLTVAGRHLSDRAIVRAGCLLVIGLAGILTDARGLFLNRWPAVIMIVLTVTFWALIRWAKSRSH